MSGVWVGSCFPLRLTLAQMEALSGIENPWVRDIALQQALGVPPKILSRTHELLKRPGFRAPSGSGPFS